MGRRQHLIGRYDIMGNGDRLIGDDAIDALLAVSGDDAVETTSAVREQAMAQILARKGLVLRESQPTKSRVFPLGFESATTILGGASASITSRPQVIFKGQRLVVPSDVAGQFVLDDVKVGKDSQFVAEGSIPARVLQENAVDVAFELDTAQISQDITISVTNIGGAPATFRAALIGQAAE